MVVGNHVNYLEKNYKYNVNMVSPIQHDHLIMYGKMSWVSHVTCPEIVNFLIAIALVSYWFNIHDKGHDNKNDGEPKQYIVIYHVMLHDKVSAE